MSQPSYQNAEGYIGESFFTINFDVPLDAVNPPALAAFDIQVNGTGVSASSLTVNSSAKTVTLNLLGYTLLPGDVIDFVYTDPTGNNDVNAIQGTDGADAASFVHSIVVAINRPGPSAPPTPSLSAASDSGTLGDGITNDNTPTVSGTAAASATVKLYDTDGTTLLGSTTADGSGNWTITSSALSDGAHSLKVTQTDGSSATSPLSTGLTLQIDTQVAAPNSLSVKPSSDSGVPGDGISNSATPVITGQSEAGAAVRLYTDNGTTLLGSATADNSGTWSITSSTLTEGSHTLTAVQTDKAGNVSLASAGFTYVLDTVGPTGMALSTTQVSQTQATAGSTVATLSSTDISAVTYQFATGNGVIDADNGRFVISGNTFKVAGASLTTGTYHVYLSATDAAGNASYQIFSLNVVDTPSVTSIVRAAGSPSGVAANATGISYTVTFDQSVTGVDASDFALTSTGTASGTISSVSGSGTTYTVSVNALSGDGTLRLDLNNSGTGIVNGSSQAISGGYTAGATYTLDHTPPAAPASPSMNAASDTGSSSTDGITRNTTPTFTGSAESGSTVRLYDTDGTTLLGSTTATAGTWTITSSTLASGSHTLTVKATDAAGNVSAASSGKTVVIDTSANAPSVPALAAASDSGLPGDNRTNDSTPTLTGTAEAFALVTVYDTGGIMIVGSATADASGAWSITTATLLDGAHTLTAEQTDVAGNTSSASSPLTLTIDTSIPTAPATPQLNAASDSGVQGDGITNVARPVITGSSLANATVTLYDSNGTTVLGSSTADGSGHWSITSSTLAVGTHNLTVKQANAAGSLSQASQSLDLTIVAAPVTPGTPSTPGTQQTIDGVLVTQQSVTLPGGGTGTQVSIPVITSGRVDASGNTVLADIPLASSGGSNLLLAQLPVGFGLSASGGASQPAGNSLQQLIQAIIAATPNNATSDQAHLTSNGTTFLNKLAASSPLLVETIVPIADSSTAPAATLTLTGTSSQHTALVIDASQLPAQSKLALDSVDFAAIVGSAQVTGTTNGQILTGDAASQQFTVKADSGSNVFAGGGSDTLVVNTVPDNNAAPSSATTLVHGGSGNDQAVFSGASSDYDVQFHEGHVVVINKAQPADQVVVVNAESLAFSDTTLAIQSTAAQTTLAGFYQQVLGRQADYQGFEYWANEAKNGASLGQIAISIINSAEHKGQQTAAFTGNNADDIEVLYQTLFGRQSDAGGKAYWVEAMQQGMTLEQVAQSFATASEMDLHQITAQGWDFIV